jgi:hypothetical protein
MYEITCPYCGFDNHCWEVEKAHGLYVPHLCDKCKKIWYLFQRSWFDLTYDNNNVEVHQQAWVDKLVKANKLIKVGDYSYGKELKPKTKDVAYLYARKYNPLELKMKKAVDDSYKKALNSVLVGDPKEDKEFEGLKGFFEDIGELEPRDNKKKGKK